jgi:ribosomal protein S18 acetylase RimI-like enzyme
VTQPSWRRRARWGTPPRSRAAVTGAYAGRVPWTSPPAELSRTAFVAELDALTDVYLAAMRPSPAQLLSRRAVMERHARYSGFRALAVCADDSGGPGGPEPAGQIIGFSYGFRSADGQWWHDVVFSALTARAGNELAAAWLTDTLEIAEVHVHPDFQHRGIGRSLVLGLADGRKERTAVLSTPDRESTARRLYRGLGFADLMTGYVFPGSEPEVRYAVMGALLPLSAYPARPSRL